MSTPDRRAMLDRNHPELPVRRQCALLSLARSGFYRPVPTEDETDLALMRRIDELFLAHPFLGSRRMATMLSREGARVNRKRVQRLIRLMGIEALGPKPNTSKPAPGHKIYPYLLRGLAIERPNHVWAADITYIPIGEGFLYLVDGRGRWLDNVFIERLWRSLKHEEVYLKGYADGREARAGIAAWIAFYNTRRPHQALGGQTPLVVWRTGTSDALGARAVDLTLRLDNAGALPTGPQPHEQRQALVA